MWWRSGSPARNHCTPVLGKVVAVATYALSTIDLIPDFVPVLGYLDHVVIVPLGILLAVPLISSDLMAKFREPAARDSSWVSILPHACPDWMEAVVFPRIVAPPAAA